MDFREDSWSDRVLNALTGRRVPLASPQAKAERERLRSWAGVVLAIVLGAMLAAGVVYSRKAMAGTESCESFAKFAEAVAVYRDVDANRDKVILVFKRVNPQVPPALWRALEREAVLVWAEKLPPEDARDSAFRRCIERMGDMGEVS